MRKGLLGLVAGAVLTAAPCFAWFPDVSSSSTSYDQFVSNMRTQTEQQRLDTLAEMLSFSSNYYGETDNTSPGEFYTELRDNYFSGQNIKLGVCRHAHGAVAEIANDVGLRGVSFSTSGVNPLEGHMAAAIKTSAGFTIIDWNSVYSTGLKNIEAALDVYDNYQGLSFTHDIYDDNYMFTSETDEYRRFKRLLNIDSDALRSYLRGKKPARSMYSASTDGVAVSSEKDKLVMGALKFDNLAAPEGYFLGYVDRKDPYEESGVFLLSAGDNRSAIFYGNAVSKSSKNMVTHGYAMLDFVNSVVLDMKLNCALFENIGKGKIYSAAGVRVGKRDYNMGRGLALSYNGAAAGLVLPVGNLTLNPELKVKDEAEYKSLILGFKDKKTEFDINCTRIEAKSDLLTDSVSFGVRLRNKLKRNDAIEFWFDRVDDDEDALDRDFAGVRFIKLF
ncbi:hypothetical protein KY337_01765 [Candidatus Woesearchaeota archaeon]|nr:hypothetical protein [Candidatus Woesearchaeota archaeon]